jgi:hypothetical protein
VRSPEEMADSKLERVESKLPPDCEEDPGAGADSNVLRAVWADDMSPEDKALSTLVRKVPTGSVPLVLRGLAASSCARYSFAELRSPELIADSSSESVLLKVSFVELVEVLVLEEEDVEDESRSLKDEK